MPQDRLGHPEQNAADVESGRGKVAPAVEIEVWPSSHASLIFQQMPAFPSGEPIPPHEDELFLAVSREHTARVHSAILDPLKSRSQRRKLNSSLRLASVLLLGVAGIVSVHSTDMGMP